MHDEEAKDMVDQLLKADKIISEQQLGWTWKAPDMVLLQGSLHRPGQAPPPIPQHPGSMGMSTVGNNMADTSDAALKLSASDFVGESGGQQGAVATTGFGGGNPNMSAAMLDALPVSLRSSANLPGTSSAAPVMVSGARIRAVLRLLATEAGFLLNAQVSRISSIYA